MSLVLSVLVAIVAIAAPASADQVVKIGATPSFSFLPLYAADQLGYFKSEGLTAQFADFEGGAEVTTAMVGGAIDFAGTYAERPMILAEKGFAAKNLLALVNRNPMALVVRKDLAATDVRGLKGTKLGMTRAGSGTDFALRAVLRDAGLEPDRDVAVIAVGGTTSATAALRAGQVDGFMGAEPAVSIAVHQLGIARFFMDALRGQGPAFLQHMTFPTLQVSDRTIQANADVVERVVRAVVKTQKRLRDDLDAGVQVAHKIFPKLDLALIRAVISTERVAYAPTITEDAMRTVNQFQKKTGAIKSDFPYDRVVAVQFKRLWDDR